MIWFRRLLLASIVGAFGVAAQPGLAAPTIPCQDYSSGGSGTVAIDVKDSSLIDHEIDNSEWHFVISQLATQPPCSIRVTWANGQQETVPINKLSAATAHYTTTSNLDAAVTSAIAWIYAAWESGGGNGQFNLSHGPSAATPELDSMILFGAGGLGLAAYVWNQRRGRRRAADSKSPEE
jgi:hypothetical protein